MGRDKALLRWGRTTLLDHAVERLRSVCGTVAVLSGPAPRYPEAGVPEVPDLVPDRGPLGALVTALEHARAGLVLLLAVDVPFAPEGLLRHLLASAVGADAVVPVAGGRPQPLCAAYRTSCLGPARRRLERGELKMTSFWSDVLVRTVGEPELSRFGDPAELLRNLNSPQDYAQSRPAGS
jgi:molybdenum cofactor guanylyltransferase